MFFAPGSRKEWVQTLCDRVITKLYKVHRACASSATHMQDDSPSQLLKHVGTGFACCLLCMSLSSALSRNHFF